MFDTIAIPQRLSYKEFLYAMLYVFVSSRRIRMFFLLMIIIMSSSQLLGYLTAPKYDFGLASVFLIAKVMVCMMLGGLTFVTILTFIVYRMQSHLFKNVSYEFSHWGITRDGEGTVFAKPWRDITRYKESKRFFVIYAGLDPHIIQKSMLGDVERINIFRSMLEENIRK